MAEPVFIIHGKAELDTTPMERAIVEASSRAGQKASNVFNQHFKNNSFQALGRITGKANEFQKSLEASNARVIAFGASVGAIFAVRAAFDKLVGSTIEVEKQLTEIDSILQLGSSNLQRFSKNLFDVANATSMAFAEATKAATEFSRQGLSVEETLKRTSAALALSRLSGMGVEESVSSLTATLNSFTREALEAEDIINRLTSVDAQYAISADDLAKALSRVSASANDAKVSFNETIALITAAQQITARGGSVIGNAFKSIFTRLQRPKVLDDLEAAGIQVRDLSGKLLPMITILRNLSGTYDTLSSSQKSFVSETVGGVYQVNILKAVLKDLGSGASAFEGAMNAAEKSTGMAERRMQSLNNTISSQLVRTMNELTRASANVGNALLSTGMKGGIGGFEKILKAAGDLMDKTNTEQGSATSQTASILAQGLAKGAGNVLQGPGVQFVVFTLMKLFERLEKFIVDSAKDLTGVNNKEKERLALNESIAHFLNEQGELVKGVLTGTTSTAQATEMWLQHMNDIANKYKVVAMISQAMGQAVPQHLSIREVGGVTGHAAKGLIPNSSMEINDARRGGYHAGQVVKTVVNAGSGDVPVIANTAETRSSIMMGGKSGSKMLDFINPPKGSMAGKIHQAEAIRRTGIDPYELPQMPVTMKAYLPRMRAARGAIPNLNVSAQSIQAKLDKAGLPYEKWHQVGAGVGKDHQKFELGYLPEYGLNLLDKLVDRYQHNPEEILAVLRSFAIRGNTQANATANLSDALDAKGRYNMLRGFATNPYIIKQGLFKDLRLPDNTLNKDVIEQLTSSLVGQRFLSPKGLAEEHDKETALDPKHVQMMLDRYASTIKTVAAMESVKELRAADDRPDNMVEVSQGGQKYKFNAPIYGHKTFFNEEYADFAKAWQAIIKSDEPVPASKLGKIWGDKFDQQIIAMAKRSGISLRANENAAIDIPTAFEGILKHTNITGPVSGIELKGTAAEALEPSGGVGEKIFKVLAGYPSVKGKADKKLSGPVDETPLLANAPLFSPEKGGIGILDRDKFLEANPQGGSEFQKVLYAAIAKGMPLKINFGAIGSGKTVAAEKMAAKFNEGGNISYIKSMEDLDSVSQVIYTSAARQVVKNMSGLAFAAASQVEHFKPPTDMADTHEVAAESQSNIEFLKKKLGKRFISANYAKGMISEALNAENLATGGHGILSHSDRLKSILNPAGLAAIDSRSQSNADEAINQHIMLGQSMDEIRNRRSARGAVPNLAIGEPDGIFGGNSVANSIYVALSSYGSQLATTKGIFDRVKIAMGNVVSSLEQNEIKIRGLTGKYQKAQQDLLAGKEVNFEGSTIKGQDKLEELQTKFNNTMKSLNTETQQAYRKAKEENAQSTRNTGYKLAFTAGGVGGIASTALGRFSPNAAAATDEFTMGLQTAGQVLAAFPNEFGKSLSLGTGVAAAASAVDVFSKGLAQARKDYEVAQSKFQKLSSQIDGIAVSINNYDSLLNDSAVTYETLVRESRKYNELLVQMSQNANGVKALMAVAGSPDNRSKSAGLLQYKEGQTRELDRQANLLSLKEYADKKTFLGIGNPLGFSNSLEKNEISQLMRNLSSSGISSADNELKQALLKASDSPEEFNAIVANSRGDFKDFLNSLKAILGDKNANKVLDSLRQNLSTEKQFTDPEGVRQLRGLQNRNAQRQLNVDAAIRMEAMLRRVFVNQGSLRANNTLDLRGIGQRNQYEEGNLNYARRQALKGLYDQQYGERSVRTYETSSELARIESERQNKTAGVSGQVTRQITDMLTQNFDEYVKNAQGNQLMTAGEAPIGRLPSSRQNLIESLNKGIAATVAQGNFDRFNENGQLNPTALIKAIQKNSGGSQATQQSIGAYLEGRNSLEILKVIQNANNELVNINREALTESQKQTIALEGFMREADFKKLSSFMGGIKNLMDRGSRRSMEREAVKSLALLRNGTTAEIRGQGGQGLLDWFKQQNIPIDLSGKSNTSKLMVEAWQAAAKGIEATQRQSLGRILGGGSRLAGDVSGIAGIIPDLKKSAQAALLSANKPENSQILNQGLSDISSSTQAFDSALRNSIRSVQSFATNLTISAARVAKAAERTEAARKQYETESAIDAKGLPINKKQRQAALRAEKERQSQKSVSTGDAFMGSTVFPKSDDAMLEDSNQGYEYPWARIGIPAALAAGAIALRGIRGSRQRKELLAAIKGIGGMAGSGLKGMKYDSKAPSPTRDWIKGKASALGGLFSPSRGGLSENELSIVTSTKEANDLKDKYAKAEAANATLARFKDRGNLNPQERKEKADAIRAQRAARFAERDMQAKFIEDKIRNKGITTIEGVRALDPSMNRETARKRLYGAFPDFKMMSPEERAIFSKTYEKPQATGSPTVGGAARGYGRGGVGIRVTPSGTVTQSQAFSRVASGVVPSFAPTFAPTGGGGVGRVSRFAPMAGGIGGMLASYGLQEAGFRTGGKTGAALTIASLLAPTAVDAGVSKLAAGGLVTGGRALLTGGAGSALFGSGAAATLGSGALIAGSAYGGFKAGQFLDRNIGYSRFSGLNKIQSNNDEALSIGGKSVREAIIKDFQKGKSIKQVEAFLKGQISSSEKNTTGWYAGLIGLGQSRTSQQNQTADLKNLLSSLSEIKAGVDNEKAFAESEKKQTEIMEKQAALLDAQVAFFTGGGKQQGTNEVKATIAIDISLKDGDKIPDVLMEKLINPLKKQLSDLQTQTNILVNDKNPQPAKV